MTLIMVIEDEPHVRLTIVDWLSAVGYRVVDLENGEEALKWFDSHRERPRAALVDIKLTGMNGFRLADRLEADYGFHDIIFVTAFFWEEETRRELAGRNHPYLEKPLKFKDQVLPLLERFAGEANHG